MSGADLVVVLSKLDAAHIHERAPGRDLLEVQFVFHSANEHNFDFVLVVYIAGTVGCIATLIVVVLSYHCGLEMQSLYLISIRNKHV